MRLSGALLAIAVALLGGGCAMAGSLAGPSGAPGSPAATAAATGAGPVEATDALGRQVAFAAPPARIVIAGKAAFMVADAAYLFPEAPTRVVALGQTSQGAGSFVPVVDAGYADKTILEGGAGPEQIAATNPDVVLMKSSNAESIGAPLEALGVPVVYVDFETPEQYTRDLGILGRLFGNEARARELIAFFEGRVERTTAALAGLEEAQKPSVLLLYYADKDGAVSFSVPPLDYIQSTMVELAGGRLAWREAQLGKGWTTVTLEQIAAWDPDQVYVVSYVVDVDEVVAALEVDPQWQALRAVRAGRLYGFPADFHSWDQPDPRWALGLTWLAATIHPERFAGLDLDAEIRAFFRDLYGLDDAAFEREIRPRLSGDLP